MCFEDIVAVLERTFKLELKVVEDTTVFDVASEDGGTKVKVLVQEVSERNLLLLSADLGEPPPVGGERLYRTMLVNTDEHEAVTTFAAGEDQKGKVIDCTQKGYKLGDKVIRFAKVVVGE